MRNKIISVFFVVAIILSMFSFTVLADENININTPDEQIKTIFRNFLSDFDESQLSVPFSFYDSNKSDSPYFIIVKGWLDGYSKKKDSYFLYMSDKPIVAKLFHSQRKFISLIGCKMLEFRLTGSLERSESYYDRQLLSAIDDLQPMLNIITTWDNPYLSNHQIFFSDVENVSGYHDKVFFYPETIPKAPITQTSEIMNPVVMMMRSLIPYLLAFLIGLVGLWKSWQFLSRQLRKA